MNVEDVYRKHAPMVLRRAEQLLGSPQQAQEVLQEIFLSLVEKPDQFDGRSKVTTFLYAATTNRCLNRLRDVRTRARLARENVEQLEPSPARDAETATSAWQILAQLPQEEAFAMIYHHMDGMTHAEIADLLGCTTRHAVYLIHRGRARAVTAEEHAP